MAGQRLQLIDGFRGFFLLFMGIHHFNGVLGTTIGKINHLHFGWVEDAQGFVFISGLVVGLVYARRYLRTDDARELFRGIYRRVGTIYSHHAGLIVILLAAALMLGNAAPSDFWPYLDEPAGFTAASLSLLAVSRHLGILPMYIYFMLAAPFVILWLRQGKYMPVFVLMVLSWLLAQTGLPALAAAALEGVLAEGGLNIEVGIYFNVFAWQVLFFSGLYFGYKMAEGRLSLEFLQEPQYRTTFFIAFAAMIVLGLFDRIVAWSLLGPEFSAAFEAVTDRGTFSFIYPIAFVIDLFIVVWLVNVGVGDRSAIVRLMAGILTYVFTRRFLVFLGQHSLHVFSFHILVYYALVTVVPSLELNAVERVALLAVSAASLYLAAWGHARSVARQRARREMVAAPGRAG